MACTLMQFEIVFIHIDIFVVTNYVYCHLFIELHINIMLNPIRLDKNIFDMLFYTTQPLSLFSIWSSRIVGAYLVTFMQTKFGHYCLQIKLHLYYFNMFVM